MEIQHNGGHNSFSMSASRTPAMAPSNRSTMANTNITTSTGSKFPTSTTRCQVTGSRNSASVSPAVPIEKPSTPSSSSKPSQMNQMFEKVNVPPETDKLLKNTENKSITESKSSETCINVGSLEIENGENQQSEAWKRKKRRSINDDHLPTYLRSAKIKRVRHPLEENVIIGFFATIFNALLMLLISIPLSIFLIVLYVFATFCRKLIIICSKSGLKGCCSCHSDMLSPHDAQYFFQENYSVIHSVLIIDGSLGLKKVKHLIASRIVDAKDGTGQRMYPRMTQVVVPLVAGPAWAPDNHFNLHNHIFSGPSILTEESLQKYVASLLPQPLPPSRPLWEVVVLHDYGLSKDTVLICRLHQCISDGMALIRVLCQSLSDNQIIHIPQKPHFGGTTYGMGLFRSAFIGPLTFLTWICWRPQTNLLTVTKGLTSLPKNELNASKKPCCGCSKQVDGSSSGGSTEEVGSAFTVWGDNNDGDGCVISWSAAVSFSRVTRIKQVTRTCVNDVLLAALAGALRITFQKWGVTNPPDLKVCSLKNIMFLYSLDIILDS